MYKVKIHEKLIEIKYDDEHEAFYKEDVFKFNRTWNENYSDGRIITVYFKDDTKEKIEMTFVKKLDCDKAWNKLMAIE